MALSPGELAVAPHSQTVSSIAVSAKKAARNRLGVFLGDGTESRNPLSSKHMKPIRIDMTPKKLAIEKSIAAPHRSIACVSKSVSGE